MLNIVSKVLLIEVNTLEAVSLLQLRSNKKNHLHSVFTQCFSFKVKENRRHILYASDLLMTMQSNSCLKTMISKGHGVLSEPQLNDMLLDPV